MIAGAIWSSGYAFELLLDSPELIRLSAIYQYIGLAYGPVGWFLLGVRLRHYAFSLRSWSGIAIFIVPTLTMLMVFSAPNHQWLYQEKTLVEAYGFTVYENVYGPYFWFHIGYSYLMNLLGVVMVLATVIESRALYLGQRVALMAALALPWLANAVHVFKLSVLPIDPSPTTLFISGVALYISVVRFKLGELIPVDRSAVISEMGDGVLIFNEDGRIVDINAATIDLFDGVELHVGMSIDEAFDGHRRLQEFLGRGELNPVDLVYTGFSNKVVRVSREPIEESALRLMVFRDISSDSRVLDALQVVLGGIGKDVGEKFFESLTSSLVTALKVRVGAIAAVDLNDPTMAKTLAVWDNNRFIQNRSFSLAGTIFESITDSVPKMVPRDVAALYPQDRFLKDLGIESFIGARLNGHDGELLGLLLVMDDKPIDYEEVAVSIVEILALRASAELQWSVFENRIATSESNYRQIVEATKDGVCVTDLEGRIQYLNSPMAKLLGIEREIAKGYRMTELLTTAVEDSHALTAAEDDTCELWMSNDLDRHFYVSLSRTVIKSADDSPTGILSIFVDLTDERILEDVNRQIEEQLRESQKLESLGVMASGVAHDFNNLLTPILGYVELVKEKVSDSDATRYLDKMQSASEQLADLCKQMLTYSGKGQPEKVVLNLNDQINRIEELMRASVRKSIRLTIEPAEKVPAIYADPTQVNQILVNLLINSSEAIADAGGEIKLRTGVERLRKDDPDVRFCEGAKEGVFSFLEVDDNGAGISEEILPKLFEPFFSTKFEGRGLGMAVVYGILKAHQGAIRMISMPGAGTTIKIYFPVEKEMKVVTNESIEVIEPSSVIESKGTVLVVDDEEYAREVLGEILDSLGFDVLLAKDGFDGLDAYVAGKEGITACVIDLTMPGMAGLELLERIRELSDSVPILLVSGYTRHEVKQKEAKAGNISFLQKPFTKGQFQDALEARLKAAG